MRADKGTRLRGLWLAPFVILGFACCSTTGQQQVVPSLMDLNAEQNKQVAVAKDQLAAAEAKQTWDKDDEKKFAATIASLPPAARLQLKEDLIERINTRKLRPFRKPPSGPVVCAPKLCDAAAPPTTADVPSAAPSMTPAHLVAPAESAPSQAPSRVVGKAAAK